MARGATREMPNYSHGTAGIVDYLVAVTQRIDERDDERSRRDIDDHIRGAMAYLIEVGVGGDGRVRGRGRLSRPRPPMWFRTLGSGISDGREHPSREARLAASRE